MDAMSETEHPGIYVHVPFCRRKCPYCDFYSITDCTLLDPWLEALLGEVRMICGAARPVDTIHIGGGTPSVLDGRRLGRLVEGLCKGFDVAGNAEVAMEVNPGTVSLARLRKYRQAGVNRLNIGVQAFNDETLRFLGRIHSGREAAAAIRQAQEAGFENIGLDLLFAVPGQSKADWELELETALGFCPSHLSCYQLTYPPGTRIAASLAEKAFRPPHDGLCADMFLMAHDMLASRGYIHYEISNFSRTKALASRHNLKYWRNGPYFGLGPAAHSFCGGRRWWNVASVAGYMDAVRAGRSPVSGEERLCAEQEMIEALYLGLRCSSGISAEAFADRFGINLEAQCGEVLKRYGNEGFLVFSEGVLRLTRKGMLYADALAAALIERL